MKIAPADSFVAHPLTADGGTIAMLVAQDLFRQKADICQLLNELFDRLTEIDKAIGESKLDNDTDWETMIRIWCFVGPALYKEIEGLKETAEQPNMSSNQRKIAYATIANIDAFVYIRRLTLELNGIHIPKQHLPPVLVPV